MKRIFNYFCTIAMIAAIVACEKDPTPDGECGFQSIAFTKTANAELKADINGKVDGTKVSFVIPTETIGKSLIPTFTVTANDVVKIADETIKSGVTECKIVDGTKIDVVDGISNISVSYTVSIIENDGAAELISVSIVKDSNLSIAEDIAAEAIEPEMIVRVPGAAFQKELTVKAVGGKGDIIKINGEVAQDGIAKVDTKFPVDIEVVDENAGAKQSYVLKVGKILENTWVKVGEYGDVYTTDYLAMAVDKKNDVPYVVVLENDADGGKNKASVLTFKDKVFSALGKQKFTAGQAQYSVIEVKDAKPYVFFQDEKASTKNTHSVMIYDGTKWDFLGAQGFADKSIGLLGKYRISMAIDGATGYPVTSLTSNAANTTTGVVKRGTSISFFDGTSWDANKPVGGRTQAYGYNTRLTTCSDGVYLIVANQTEKTFSLYKYAKGWTTIVKDTPAGTEVNTTCCAIGVNAKGEFFAALGELSGGAWVCQVYKLNGNSLDKFAAPLPGTFGTSDCQWDMAFDQNGNPVLAYRDEGENSEFKVIFIDPDTKAWADPIKFEVATSAYICIDNADNGNIYMSYTQKFTHTEEVEGKIKTISDGAKVYLYKYSLEDDILPE